VVCQEVRCVLFVLRVRGEIMGSPKYRNIGDSQSVLAMINPIISPHTRRYSIPSVPPASMA
jgi:hypothetical protein